MTSGANFAASIRRAKSRREQLVHVRHEDEISAMSWGARLKLRIKNIFEPEELPPNRPDVENPPSADPIQYRLEASRKGPKKSCWSRIITCNGLFDRNNRSSLAIVGANPNQKLSRYFHWMFRVSFFHLFVVMCTMFFALVIMFSGFITLAGTLDSNCVRIGGVPFSTNDADFADAFALSWTTFSTVGYGSTAPALGFQHESKTHCFFINFILSLESLLGVLYSGFCGAILFGKVLRIQSHAQVIFSDPLVIRYGQGVVNTDVEFAPTDAESDDDSAEFLSKQQPCPVLEFRIVNRLFGEPGGEIMDATLNVVANVDADDTGDPMDTTERISVGTSLADSASETSSLEGASHRTRDISASLHRVLKFGHNHATVRHSMEDPTDRLVTKQVFSKLAIEASDHPFFKRVWLARHVLDERSPILKPRLRKHIAKLKGTWPERLCTAQHIRDALQFNQILVSLNGVSNVSANDVYAQKIYDFVDINIGYEFVNILFKGKDGSLGVDADLINDVREQRGGGGEKLIFDD